VLNLGYACINTVLREQKPAVYTGRSCIRRTFDEKGLSHVSKLIEANTADIFRILQWNVEHDITLFRMSSSMCSWATLYELSDLPDYKQICANLAKAGQYAHENSIRLSFHPGQFNVLTSPREHVFNNTRRDLELHGKLMDLLGMPRTPMAKINIHAGGVYGDKAAALDNFCRNFEKLNEAARSRITIENDDKANCYSVVDLMTVHKRIGIPIVFDYHHHKFCPGDLTERDALKLAISTWPKGIKPTVHYAESRDPNTLKPAHSDWLNGPIDDHGYDLDCMLECKMKEQALLRLRNAFI